MFAGFVVSQKKHKLMKEKQLYLAPECEEFGLRLEGVIATSADPEDYQNPFGDELDF